MKNKKNLLHPFTAAAFATVVVAMSSQLQAATFNWTGADAGSNSWTAAANWDVAPTFDNTADLVFNTLTRPIGFIAANTTVRSLSFGADMDGPFAVRLLGFAGTNFAQSAASLTFDADSGNATVTVDAGATGDINIGATGTDATPLGNLFLADNLVVNHNGTGLLLFNRPFQAGAFSITKNGTGTMQTNNNNLLTGALNLNAGTFVADSFASGGEDLDNFSAVNLDGGTLQIGASSGVGKTYNLFPLNVNSPSTLEYKNTNTATFNAAFTLTSFVINADLAVKNISTETSLVNAINLSRVITGSGDIVVTTYNNVAASTDNFTLGRVLFGGNNSAWTGDIVISRGTVSLGGTVTGGNVNAAGTGDIIIGTASDAFGAGLTFFPGSGGGSTVTYANAINVTGGIGSGFRAIKGGGTNHSVTFSGPVALNGDLTVDHTWSTADRRITLSGAISGPGGLTFTRAGGSAGTTAVLSGVSNYAGPTTVTTGASLSLAPTGSITSNITVQSGARIGGAGSTTGSLTLENGASFFFFFSASPFSPMKVSGTATLDNSFGVASLVGGSQGEAIIWENVAPGTYTLIGTTSSTFNNITDFGSGSAVTVAVGKTAYFQNGGGSGAGGLQLVVTGPSAYENWKTTNGTTGGLDEDHDGDGVENGTEYYLGGNTITTGFTPLPGVVANSVTWPAASLNSGYSGVYGTHFVVETSETLEAGSWVTAPLGTGPDTVTIPFAQPTAIRNVKYTFPTTGPRKFARLRVTGP